MKRVVVVGAGLSGIAAARSLRDRDHTIIVLEQSADFGGRMATLQVGEQRLDSGAPFFTVRDPALREALQPLVSSGVVFPWAERLHRWDGVTLKADSLTQTERRFTGREGMASVVRALAEGIDVRLGATVVGLSVRGRQWEVVAEHDGRRVAEIADVIVMAIPSADAQMLVRSAVDAVDPLVQAELDRVQFDPCAVVLAGYDPDLPPIPWRAIASTAEPLQWIGLESSKRPADERTVCLHASGEWSGANWEREDAEAVRALLDAAVPIIGDWIATPRWAQLKRWRYAKPTILATGRALLSENAGPPIAFCGDWCQAPRVEGAFQSGMAAADRLIFAGYL